MESSSTERIPCHDLKLWIFVPVDAFSYLSILHTRFSEMQTHFSSISPLLLFHAFICSLDNITAMKTARIHLRQRWPDQYRRAETLTRTVPALCTGRGVTAAAAQRKHRHKALVVSKNILLHTFYLEQTASGQRLPTQGETQRLFRLYFVTWPYSGP